MAFSFKAWFLERKYFCCCHPVRFGVLVMSFLSWILSGAVSFLLWFEIASEDSISFCHRRLTSSTGSHDPPLSSSVRIAFIVAGVVESALFLASTAGLVSLYPRCYIYLTVYNRFVGVIVRKQSLLQIYAYFHYIHFIINLGVGSYFLWIVTHTATVDEIAVCVGQNNGGQNPCNNVFDAGKGIFIGIIVLIWFIELCA